MAELKETAYPGFHPPKSKGRVAYIIIDTVVFFSGLTPTGESTTTINDAEGVIEAICEAEGLKWESCQFYDIQTHRGYRKSPGEFDVDRLNVAPQRIGGTNRPWVDSWQPVEFEELPERVRELFEPLINS